MILHQVQKGGTLAENPGGKGSYIYIKDGVDIFQYNCYNFHENPKEKS